MAKAADYRVKPIMLVAGDDAGRKPGEMVLVGKLGFEPVDAGLLKNRCAVLNGTTDRTAVSNRQGHRVLPL
jgi:predicted dinucleotide-binding enzyme